MDTLVLRLVCSGFIGLGLGYLLSDAQYAHDEVGGIIAIVVIMFAYLIRIGLENRV